MPRSTASPAGPNMSTVDRLSIPKERSKGMELTGYTLLERLREMRDIMKVKGKGFADELVKVNARSYFCFVSIRQRLKIIPFHHGLLL